MRQVAFNKDLALRWPEFVDCPKRLLTEGPFLVQLARQFPEPLILDAATGTGCEDVFLCKHGYSVISNEIDDGLRQAAIAGARNDGVTLDMRQINWKDFSRSFRPNSIDIVLLLGNSLCLLESAEQVAECLLQISSVIAEHGFLVVDERNFPYILDNRDDILRGEFRFSSRYLYCGTTITGRPVSIESDLVRFGYFHVKEGLLGTLDMLPFASGQLVSLLKSAGFSSVETYSDFRLGLNSEADFFTYVARM